ncbi:MULTISPECIES: CatB-related O-acetyltransferase [unclassified Maridesulfovibrio]|uniref:CatB-related O-acetyltransferase n=1 Tax=unclassified Maridesulfovibrio TaxID=2794999 RepID=UPI003B3E3F43
MSSDIKYPDPDTKHPVAGFPQVTFIKNFNENPNVIIGDYTYYDDPSRPDNFFENILYHFDFIGDKLIIGRYCAIARNVSFIMNGASHATGGFSTYPFFIFGSGWKDATPPAEHTSYKGDTVIGSDVWIGYDATIMPGVNIGHGSIIGAKSVVTKDVPPYSIVAGNPARVVRMRFDENTIAALLDAQWWEWEPEKVTRNLPAIIGSDMEHLQKAT